MEEGDKEKKRDRGKQNKCKLRLGGQKVQIGR